MDIAQNLASSKINWVQEAEVRVPNFEIGIFKGMQKHVSVAETLISDPLVAIKPKIEKVKHLCDDGSCGLREISKGIGMRHRNYFSQIKRLQSERVLGAPKVV